MAQSIVLKYCSETRPSKSFICHYTSHIILHEQQGYDALLGLQPIIIQENPNIFNQLPLSYADVQIYLDASSDVKPSCLVVEVPHREIGGKCSSWEDLVLMSEHCRRNGVHFHMDGARLWEASVAYPNKTISDIVSLFDSVYVSFYKGIGAISGALLLGKRDFIITSRIWQRRFGGNLYSLLPYAVSSWSSFRKYSNSFELRKLRLQEVVLAITEAFKSNNYDLVLFDPPVPEVSMVHIYINADTSTCMQARDQVVADMNISVFPRLRECGIGLAKGYSYIELNLGPSNALIAVEKWVQGWMYFCKCLKEIKNM